MTAIRTALIRRIFGPGDGDLHRSRRAGGHAFLYFVPERATSWIPFSLNNHASMALCIQYTVSLFLTQQDLAAPLHIHHWNNSSRLGSAASN